MVRTQGWVLPDIGLVMLKETPRINAGLFCVDIYNKERLFSPTPLARPATSTRSKAEESGLCREDAHSKSV